MVAVIKEKKSKELEINTGNISTGNMPPINKDWLKSGLGKNNVPPTNPKIMEK